MQSPVKVAFLISFAVFLVGVLTINEAVFNQNLWILFVATIYLFTTLWCLVYEVISLLYQARIRQAVYLASLNELEQSYPRVHLQ